MPLRSFLAVLLAASFAATAQEPPPAQTPESSGIGGQNQPNATGTGSQAFSDPSALFGGKAGAFFGLALNNIQGEGLYLSTVINTEFNLGPVGLGLSLPVNLLLINNDDCCGPNPDADGNNPHSRNSKAYSGILRRRDWDEPQDWLKFIRYVRYGHKRDPVYVLAGQMWGASIGHGTLLSRYSNSLSLDHPKFGLAIDLNGTFAGIETLTDYVGNPTILAARPYIRPFGDTPFLRGWAVGATFVTDRTAPRALQRDATGALVQDKEGNPLVTAQDPVYAGGIDTEYELLHNSVISLLPFVDLNRIAGAGNGLHIGVLTDINLPVPILDITLQARLEYRMMQAGYIPEYFDQTYDLGRAQYAVPGICPPGETSCPSVYVPKYEAAAAAHNTAADRNAIDKKGYYGELAFNFAGILQIGGLLQDYQGDPNGASLGLFATFPKLEIVKLSAYYLRKNMNGLGDAFILDERSLLAASAAYKVFGPFYLRVDFNRRWVIEPGADHIRAITTFSAGVASFVSF